MKIKPLFDSSENITIQEYLKRCGISDVDEYLSGGIKYIESPDKYDNMEQGYEILSSIRRNK